MVTWKTFIFAALPEVELPGVQLDGAAYHGLDLRSPPRQLAAVEGLSTAASPSELPSDAATFWEVVANATLRCLPPADKPWTHLHVVVRADGGWVGASLHDDADQMRPVPLTVSLMMPLLEEAVANLPAPDEDEAAFDAGLEVILIGVRNAVLAGAAAANASLEPLRRDHGLTITCVWHEDREPVQIA